MPVRNIEFAPGEYYHIYNRGVGRSSIFREPDNYLFALQRVKTYATELQITVVAYCLMPNHYHFLLHQDSQEPAGRLVQLVFNSYLRPSTSAMAVPVPCSKGASRPSTWIERAICFTFAGTFTPTR